MKSVTLLIVGAVALSLAACSRQPEKTSNQKTETPIFTVSDTAATIVLAEQRRGLQEAARIEQRAEIRARRIGEIRTAFGENSEPIPNATPWKDGVRGEERPQIFDEICRGFERFDDMERGFRLMSGSDDPPITWEDVNIEQNDAGKMYWNTGITTAQLIIKIFNDVPRAERRAARPCYEGKASWNFVDERELGGRLINMLDEIHAGANDVGMTSGELRQLLIKELKLHITELREAMAVAVAAVDVESEADSQKNVDYCLYELFMEAKTSWNITFDQLGITPREYAMIKEKTAANAASWCSEEVNLALPPASPTPPSVPH